MLHRIQAHGLAYRVYLFSRLRLNEGEVRFRGFLSLNRLVQLVLIIVKVLIQLDYAVLQLRVLHLDPLELQLSLIYFVRLRF